MYWRRVRIQPNKRRRAEALSRYLLIDAYRSILLISDKGNRGIHLPDPCELSQALRRGIDPNIDGRSIHSDGSDSNHNGRIEGDNGDGKYETTEYFQETSPNKADTDGDDKKDLDEIKDDHNRFPGQEGFNAEESTNPIDPRD